MNMVPAGLQKADRASRPLYADPGGHSTLRSVLVRAGNLTYYRCQLSQANPGLNPKNVMARFNSRFYLTLIRIGFESICSESIQDYDYP